VGIGTLILGGVAVGVYFGTRSSSAAPSGNIVSPSNPGSKGLVPNANARAALQTTQTASFGATTGQAAPPAKIDWRNMGYAVSPVKDQGLAAEVAGTKHT
jgi:hypothetical protein